MESFEQLRNNFEASYFSGALLIDRRRLEGDLSRAFAASSWDPVAFAALLERWVEWAGDPTLCDVAGKLSWFRMERLAMRLAVRSARGSLPERTRSA